MAFHYSPKITTNGLVFAVDAKNPNSQVSGGTTTYNLKDGLIGTHSASGMADGNTLTFDGASDYINCDPLSVSPISKTSGVSIECWVKFYSISSNGTIITSRNNSNVDGFYFGNIFGTGLMFQLRSSNSSSVDVRLTDTKIGGSQEFVLNTWYHIVGTIPGSETPTADSMEVHINGVKYSGAVGGNDSFTGDISNTKLYIGKRTTTDFLDGEISSVKIYNRALTASEVSQNYNTLKTRFGH